MFDILIRNATIIDGTGADRYTGDLGIQGTRIAAIGQLGDAQAGQQVDANGMVLAPGFIDVHNHSDGWLLTQPNLSAKTTQGFTSEVLMSDGISYAPVTRDTYRDWMYYLRALNGLALKDYSGWETMEDYRQQLDRKSSQNSLLQIPYANVRTIACGFGRDRVDDFQARHIKRIITREMEAGAVGLSTGLDYIAQCFSTTDEIADAASAIAPFGGIYATHIRYKLGNLAGLQEAVEIGRRSGAKVHISHFKARTAEEGEILLKYVDEVARKDVDFSFEVYPYHSGSTMLSYLLPYPVWEDGPLATLAKLRDPAIRALIREGLEAFRVYLDRGYIAWLPSERNRDFIGKTLQDWVDACGLPPEEAIPNLLMDENLAVLLVFREGDDALVRPFLQHDLGMIGSDAIWFPGSQVHPRAYGTASRTLGPAVRDWKWFSLETAVYKLSGYAAERFGLKDRGVIRENAVADLVLFDAETISDPATYDDPLQQSIGIPLVIVNGTPVVQDGQAVDFDTTQPPGRSLRFHRDVE